MGLFAKVAACPMGKIGAVSPRRKAKGVAKTQTKASACERVSATLHTATDKNNVASKRAFLEKLLGFHAEALDRCYDHGSKWFKEYLNKEY